VSNDALDFLHGGAPTAKFLTKGTIHRGRIQSFEKTQQRDIKTGALKTWDNGEPMWQLVFTIETDERDPEIDGDDGVRRIFAKANMLNAIRDAIRKSGHRGDVTGGVLAVKFADEGQAPAAGFNPPKIYQAIFQPPSQVDEFDAMAAAVEPQPAASAASSDWADEEPF